MKPYVLTLIGTLTTLAGLAGRGRQSDADVIDCAVCVGRNPDRKMPTRRMSPCSQLGSH